MKPKRNETLSMLTVAAMVLWGAGAAAQAPADPPLADPAQVHIDGATRALEQAALQANVASVARQIALLRQAQDDLRAAQQKLDGRRRTQATALLGDVQEAMDSADRQLGPLSAPDAESFGPLVPDRDQLAQLALEAQQLQRHDRQVHRLIGTVIIGSPPPRGQPPAPEPLALVVRSAEAQSWQWPYVPKMAWPQLRAQF